MSTMLSSADMAAAIAFVEQSRSGDAPFDYVHAGIMSGDRNLDIETADRYAKVGVTWWLEHFFPERMSIDAVRELIGSGPPREP
jgi:hypothetical protein